MAYISHTDNTLEKSRDKIWKQYNNEKMKEPFIVILPKSIIWLLTGDNFTMSVVTGDVCAGHSAIISAHFHDY